MEIIQSEAQLNKFVDQGLKALYFTNLDCGVCGVLKPQVEKLFKEYEIGLMEVLIHKFREVAAQQLIMQAPTLVVYLDGKEIIRRSGFIDLNRLKMQLERMLS